MDKVGEGETAGYHATTDKINFFGGRGLGKGWK